MQSNFETGSFRAPSVHSENGTARQNRCDLGKAPGVHALVSVRSHGIVAHLMARYEQETGMPAINIDFGGLDASEKLS